MKGELLGKVFFKAQPSPYKCEYILASNYLVTNFLVSGSFHLVYFFLKIIFHLLKKEKISFTAYIKYLFFYSGNQKKIDMDIGLYNQLVLYGFIYPNTIT